MIKVEGYKAFRGTMLITPKNQSIKPMKMYGDWLYKPDCDCWYGCGSSFSADICEVVEED